MAQSEDRSGRGAPAPPVRAGQKPLAPAAQRALAEAAQRRAEQGLNKTDDRTKESGGPVGPEPTRYGDWEKKGLTSDF